jgi:hypothetical protein
MDGGIDVWFLIEAAMSGQPKSIKYIILLCVYFVNAISIIQHNHYALSIRKYLHAGVRDLVLL